MPRPPSPSRSPAEADLLAFLPAHLLDEVLTRLDLREAVRTSALSRAWRHRWESVPALALSFPDGTPPWAVDSVLLHYSGPRISRFAFSFDDSSAGRINDWLIELSRRSVESISLSLSIDTASKFFLILHSFIFSCAHLVSLDISFCIMPMLPVGFAGFSMLEELKLSYVQFPDNRENLLQTVIRGSPLLRVLYLLEVTFLSDCVSLIEASNLRTLTLISVYDDWIFGELPCLEDAYIDVSEYYQFADDFGQFLVGISQVRELSLHCPGQDLVIPDTLPFIFCNLKSLKLSTFFVYLYPISAIFCLLRSSPNLEKLEIEIRLDEENEEIASWEFLNAEWTDGMCANLQVVQIISMNRFPNEISFMKLILCKASRLRVLSLSMDDCPVSENDPLNELLKCRRASAVSQVLFKEAVEMAADD